MLSQANQEMTDQEIKAAFANQAENSNDYNPILEMVLAGEEINAEFFELLTLNQRDVVYILSVRAIPTLINHLFNADESQLNGLLGATNTLTNSLALHNHPAVSYLVRRAARMYIVNQLNDKYRNARTEDARSELKRRVDKIANELALIQKTDKDRDDKTAKRILQNYSVLLVPSDEFQTVYKIFKLGLDMEPDTNVFKQPNASCLVNPLSEDAVTELRAYLRGIEQKLLQQLKHTLLNDIKTLFNEYKLHGTNGDETPHMIDEIKSSYDSHQSLNKTTSALIEILRMHEDGTPDQKTGTWKAFMKTMEKVEANHILSSPSQGNGDQIGRPLEDDPNLLSRLLLAFALGTEQKDLAEVLFKKHANREIDIRPDAGYLPLMYAASSRENNDIKNLLRASETITPEYLDTLHIQDRNKLRDLAFDCVGKNIENLFLIDLSENELELRKLLNITNTLTNSELFYDDIAISYKYRKALRLTLINALDGKFHDANTPAARAEFKHRVEIIANELALIQRKKGELKDKTAKQKCMHYIRLLDGSEQFLQLYMSLNKLLANQLRMDDIETLISGSLVTTLDEQTANQLTNYLRKLGLKETEKLKHALHGAILKLSGTYKSDDDSNNEQLSTIAAVKKSYDAYKRQGGGQKQTTALIEILRTHQFGERDRDTGTWKAFVKIMEDGNFNRLAPARTSFLGGLFGKKQSSHDQGEELKLLPSSTSS